MAMAMAMATSTCISHCREIPENVHFSHEFTKQNTLERMRFAPLRSNFMKSRRAYSVDGRLTFGVSARTTAITDVGTTERANLAEMKANLLAAVSGLDRGLVATGEDENLANAIAVNLESVGGVVVLPENLDKLQGKWRLIYSSGFKTGSLGGQRPGPNITRIPLVSIGLVYQRIDVSSRELDNIVDLNFPTPWPLPPFQLTATLAHNFEVVGRDTIKIVFEKTIVKPVGGLSSFPPFELPRIELPEFLQSSRNVRSGEFTPTYVDKDLRISRGDRGELRIFVRS